MKKIKTSISYNGSRDASIADQAKGYNEVRKKMAELIRKTPKLPRNFGRVDLLSDEELQERCAIKLSELPAHTHQCQSPLGSFLYRKRRALKLTRAAFAKKIGMSYPGIYYLETGKQKIVYPPTLKKISQRLKVDIKKLLKLNKRG